MGAPPQPLTELIVQLLGLVVGGGVLAIVAGIRSDLRHMGKSLCDHETRLRSIERGKLFNVEQDA